jgi:hypothetical protein
MVDDFYEPTFSDYSSGVLRRWPVVLVAALIGVVVMLLAPVGRAVDDGAEVTFRVVDEQNLVDSIDLPVKFPAASATDKATRLQSEAVSAAIRDTLGTLPDFTVTSNEAAGILTATVTAPDPDTAREQAQGIADAFTAQQRATRQQTLTNLADTTEAQITSLQESLDAALEKVRTADDATRSALEVDYGRQSGALVTARSRLASIDKVAELTTGGVVANSAVSTIDGDPGWSPLTRIALGLVLGAIGGILVALVLVLIDRRLYRRVDVELVAAGVPVLGSTVDGPTEGARLAALAVAVRAHTSEAVTVLGVSDDEGVEALAAALRDEGIDVVAGRAVLGEPTEALPVASAVLLAVRAGRTTDDQLRSALTLLEDADSAPCGLVLTGVRAREVAAATAGLPRTATDG